MGLLPALLRYGGDSKFSSLIQIALATLALAHAHKTKDNPSGPTSESRHSGLMPKRKTSQNFQTKMPRNKMDALKVAKAITPFTVGDKCHTR